MTINRNRARFDWNKLSDDQVELLRNYGITPAIRRRARQEMYRRAAEQAKAERKAKR